MSLDWPLSSELNYLAHCNFEKAVLELEKKRRDEKTPDLNYYYAVARLGELLQKSNDVKPDSAHVADIRKKTKEELEAIKLLFKGLKPSKSIEHAMELIDTLVLINNYDLDKRTRALHSTLLTFQLSYTTKIHVFQKLIPFEKGYFFSISIPKSIKNVRKIFGFNADDLYLSSQQINQLYKECQHYKHNEKYQAIFERLEESLFLFDHHLFDEKYQFIYIWRHYSGIITSEKVMVLLPFYNTFKLRNLRGLINALSTKNLLDNALPHLKTIAFNEDHFIESIKHVANLVADNCFVLTHLFDFAWETLEKDATITSSYLYYMKAKYIGKEDTLDISKIFIYLDLLSMIRDSKEKIPIKLIFNLMKETELTLSEEHFIALGNKVLHYKIAPIHFILLMNLALQLGKDSIESLLNLIDHYPNKFDVVQEKANALIERAFYLKYPEKPLEEVIHDFQTKSEDVEYPIDKGELKQLELSYLQIKKIGEQIRPQGRIGLQSALSECKKILSLDPQNERAKLTLLALIRLQIKEKITIYPYNIQMLNLLALLNEPRRIAQIKTGEGKSTLIAMLSAFYGLMQHKVDIITTTEDLALRDAAKYEPFYKALGLTVDHNLGTEKHRGYTSCIVYGTVSDFEFAYLRGETQREQGRGERPYDVAIVDEVDSMFIDMQRNQAILSCPSEEGYKPEVYHIIWKWIEETDEKEQSREHLQTELKSKGIEISLDLATTWLKSALTAQFYSENREYIIATPKDKSTRFKKEEYGPCIKIVDKRHTGQISGESTRWQGGLHQLLEAKHNLKIHVETLITGSISHIEFFNKYRILTGVTGTLGGQSSRDELNQLYKVTTYDSPSYKPSLRQQVPHVIERTEKTQMTAVQKEIQRMTQAGRPVLLLCEDIEESRKFYTYLSKKFKYTQVYNGTQELAADKILGLSGNPGAITIATNCAGRGTDIITTASAELNGGLHVIMTFPAINLRVERQAFGRTGRQGKKGTYHYILRDDQLSEPEIKDTTIEEKILLMHKKSAISEKTTAMNNLFYHNIMHKLFIMQSVFFLLPMEFKEKHMRKWAKVKTEANKRAMQYINKEVDESESDEAIILKIHENFNEFWTENVSYYGELYKNPIKFIEAKLKELVKSDLSQDKYLKNLLIESILFLKDPRFYFASDVSSSIIDMKTPEIIASLEVSEAIKTPKSMRSTPCSSPKMFKSPPLLLIEDKGESDLAASAINLLPHQAAVKRGLHLM